jgi:HPt (histidine-containing phosphotransfer) domain-containing protein
MPFTFSDKLDRGFLDSLYGDDIPYAQEVFTEFLKNTKSEFETIKAAYKDNDLKKIRQHLHKIKPTFAFVGLSELTERSEKLIGACDASSDVSQIEPICSELFNEIEGSFKLVENELERMKTHAG